ncbi:MAG: DNA-binding protein [Candidatus Diapherotrites archaeon]|uniref:DNA-binding protein n=1 Tax=Candidatus Iainarchaeum sp. TaxID=3101447 RepID=A0A2D6LQ67_9ARCH|nr:DNA-binding protein [Candidatus Diapherotrites archaeon]|tara:strand:- start:25878 stop:26192 length:315 start_codon:yes stop_codon:yes gene_type:complete
MSEDLKEKKLDELKQKYLKQQEEENQALEMEDKMQSILKSILTEEAKQRLSNVRLVNKELYTRAFQAIMGLVQKGMVQGKLNEEQVKEILRQLNKRRDINITRK